MVGDFADFFTSNAILQAHHTFHSNRGNRLHWEEEHKSIILYMS